MHQSNMDLHNHNHAVRKIVLPSGRSIEVVRFDEAADTGFRLLHVCPVCSCELVQPHDWAEAPDASWHMTLECPNCGWLETGTYSPSEVEALEEHLDAGVEEMIGDLRRLTRANMLLEVDRFTAALEHDLILPEDF
jgi:hypothetical protein